MQGPPSEADSDDRRKRLSSELRRAFDHYLNKNNNGSNNLQDGFTPAGENFASQHNVEFETISNTSKDLLKPEDVNVTLGKRRERPDSIKDDHSFKGSEDPDP